MILLNVNYSQLKRQFETIRGYILLFGQKNIACYISTQQYNLELTKIDNIINNNCLFFKRNNESTVCNIGV